MNDTERTIKKYLRRVTRRLNMSRSDKARVISDLRSSIIARQESGQSAEEIIKELGTPKQAAAELNTQMKEYTYRKSPWRWLCLGVAILCGMVLLFGGSIGILTFLINKSINSSLGIIGGADGPTAIFIATPDGYVVQQFIIYGILLVLGIVGYLALSRLKRKP